MNRSWTDQFKTTGKQFTEYWQTRSPKNKGIIIGSFLILVLALSTFIYFASRPSYTPLYSGQLTQREVGDIKAELDKQGYSKYKLSDSGNMLLVPKKDAPDLVVSLASKGYPKDNGINYDIFGSNLSFGATDRQYDILEREAMQNQVAQVIKHVDGIKNAEVILTLPQNSVFVRQDDVQKASASVMVEVEPGIRLNTQQIRALYTLVSHGVPNLPLDNITIMNQYSETLPLQDTNNDELEVADKFEQQMKIQKNIQQDIQQNLQSLLGTILGTDKVFVSTFVKMNFDKVKTEQKLVQPVENTTKGVPISSEKNTKTSTGDSGSGAGGVVGTGESQVPGYTGTDSNGKSTYEETQERVNYEVSRINNEIIKSPYQIEDITINVGVAPDSPNSKTLSKAATDNIRNIVSNTVRTALGHPELSQKEIDQRITIFPHIFAQTALEQSKQAQNNWLYILAAAAAGMLIIGGGIWAVNKRKRKEEEEFQAQQDQVFTASAKEADYFAEEELSVEKQLKKLLDQRPEDFTKVIRTWLNEGEM